ncbi:DNA oxidative demethylase AlkB [Neopusillimonas aromaticivorans]|uniref:DNA oxidative demethylase AlkB n=1 Tax=Neopusillimonas aromaticivorans TaxID=2979868 RepID=UPI002593C536|nr:DNA oxidative demethylase AlkB [Neopusillimonas aromaticivorans]WJJ94165.1 DNA oxidative demethylase AlkB [Neopusillimonas aromaticivorans]
MSFQPFVPISSASQIPLLPELSSEQSLGSQAWLLKGYALPHAGAIFEAVADALEGSPLRKMSTARGWMSVAQSNCGAYGWVSDRTGYRYATSDPLTGTPWPAMPPVLYQLAVNAAQHVGFGAFDPQACLINYYEPGSRMGLHQDRDEADLKAPIVSVSLGLPAVFQFGGLCRTDPVQKVGLEHGDVLVWGGVDRLRFHGVMTVKSASSPLAHAHRLNLTFRRVT